MNDDRGLPETPEQTKALMDNLAFNAPTDPEYETTLLAQLPPRAQR